MLKAKRMTPYIVDVDFTITDETYYPLIGRSKYNDVYASRSLGDLVRLLEGDGWGQCGKILGNDGQTQLQMFGKRPTAAERYLASGKQIVQGQHLIAVGEE